MKTRGTALFDAFMTYGRAHFQYRTTGITKPLTSMYFIDSKCLGNLRTADGGALEGGPRFFFSQHWWVKSSAGNFDPTAGLSGDLSASVAIQGLIQKGKSYGTGDASLIVTLAGQGETGGIYSVKSVLPT